jgi:hypothetical protein
MPPPAQSVSDGLGTSRDVEIVSKLGQAKGSGNRTRSVVGRRRAVERQRSLIVYGPRPRRDDPWRISTAAKRWDRFDACLVSILCPAHAATERDRVVINHESEHGLTDRHIGRPSLKMRLKDVRVRLRDPDRATIVRNSGRGKAERRTCPDLLYWRDSGQNADIPRDSWLQDVSRLPERIHRRRCFEFPPDVAIEIVSEA